MMRPLDVWIFFETHHDMRAFAPSQNCSFGMVALPPKSSRIVTYPFVGSSSNSGHLLPSPQLVMKVILPVSSSTTFVTISFSPVFDW